jgi:hypothetical protein
MRIPITSAPEPEDVQPSYRPEKHYSSERRNAGPVGGNASVGLKPREELSFTWPVYRSEWVG